MKPDLRVVASESQPSVLSDQSKDTFCFMRDGDVFMAMHNGKIIPPGEACLHLANIVGAYLQRRKLARAEGGARDAIYTAVEGVTAELGAAKDNETASTPRGLL